MRIIVLEGANNTGKTTTMGLVYASLVSNGAVELVFTVMPNNEDFETLLFYQGKIVAIVSHGDISGNYNTAVNTYNGTADVLVIADSTNSSMNTQPSIVLTKTSLNGLAVQVNTIDCRKITSLI